MISRLGGIPLLLAGGLCLFPFLMPYHRPPLWTFHSEWLAFALGTTTCIAMLVFCRGHNAVSTGMAWLLGFAALILLSALTSALAYPQQALLAALYVLFAAIMIWAGAQLRQRFSFENAAAVIAGFLLAGALFNAFAGIVQYHGLNVSEDLITELRSRRVYGNIAQANLYANYLSLGATSLVYLWLKRSLNAAIASLGLVVIAYAAELSGSRAALLYVIWPLALAWLLHLPTTESTRLRRLCMWAAVITVATHALAMQFHTSAQAAPGIESGMGRLLQTPDPMHDPRLGIWKVALQIIADSPLTGVGIGEFPGAAFRAGLPAFLSAHGNIWTSPHNLPLHLMAETGIAGLALVLLFFCRWGAHAVRTHGAEPSTASWWAVACLGIEFIHSMGEFPLWFAHFLGPTALLLGLCVAETARSIPARRTFPWLIATICLALASALALTLRDYVRLDSTRITGTGSTLADMEQVRRDAASLASLGEGLLAPTADFWIVLKAQMNQDQLQQKLQASSRSVRLFPGPSMTVRHAVFLAFDGQSEAAHAMLRQSLSSFPQRCDLMVQILAEAVAAAPQAIAPLQSLAFDYGCGR